MVSLIKQTKMQKPAELRIFPEQEELFRRISEGDEEAFALFFKHYYLALNPFVLKFTKSQQDTEEVLQDIFIRVWLNRDKIQDIEHIDAWIYKVASRECLSFLRNNLSNRENLTGIKESQQFPDLRGYTPLDAVSLEEINQAVTTIVNGMPAQRKKIFQMSRDEGLKPSEIAEALSLSVSTVKNVLTICLKEIRTHLVRMGFDFLLVLFLLLKNS